MALSLDEATIEQVAHDPTGDPLTGVPVISPLACVLGYHYPVHLIGPDFRPAEMPPAPTWILLVRNRDDDVRFHDDLDADEGPRYRMANTEAARYAEGLERRYVRADRVHDMLAELRHFYRMGLDEKRGLIARHAA